MIIIAGASGYVGRYLCKEMVKSGHEILALGRSKKVTNFFADNNIPYQYFDITSDESYEQLPKNGVTAVINLAALLAEHEVPVEKFFEVNTVGNYKLLEYCKQNNIKKFIYASSHKVYNDISNVSLIDETMFPCFNGDHTPYIISKIAGEHFVEYYNKDFGMEGICLRLTGVHGYGEILGQLDKDGSYIKSTFEIFVEKAIKAEPIEVWGDASQVRDHIYIKDVITAFIAAIHSKGAKGIYNIASGQGVSWLEEAQHIAEVFGPTQQKKSEIILRPDKTGLTRSYVYSIEKAKRDLQWQPQYSYKLMLEDYKREQENGLYHHYHYIKEDQRPATL